MPLTQVLFGRRLASDEEEKEQIGPLAGIPALGLDALASAAYGPEAALTVLLPLGALGLPAIVPEVVEPRWYLFLLHNHTASILKWLLLYRGTKGIVVIDMPWHLRDSR